MEYILKISINILRAYITSEISQIKILMKEYRVFEIKYEWQRTTQKQGEEH